MESKPRHNISSLERFELALTSMFGAGFVPWMPGTCGSLVALLLLLAPVKDIHLLLAVCAVVAFCLGLVVVPDIQRLYGSDPQIVVLDEAAGMWLVLATPLIPHTLLWITIAFLLFRLFDIWKPFPIKIIDRKDTAFSVMADDIVAALYASFCLHLFYHTFLALPLVERFLGLV